MLPFRLRRVELVEFVIAAVAIALWAATGSFLAAVSIAVVAEVVARLCLEPWPKGKAHSWTLST